MEGMTTLKILKSKKIKGLVNKRIKEFEELRKKSSNELFKELCFCILTANCAAGKCIEIQKNISNGFLTFPKRKLANKLKELGYRFPNKRAEYVVEARKHKDSLKKIIKSFDNQSELREWLVNNIKGLGYKEASHFLRNIGFKGLAILDFHIINNLVKCKLIKKPKTFSKKKYLEIENKLRRIAKKLNLNLAELDLYLWCAETGKVLK